jgi:uncharacterized membrane protein YdjX (TVP38/TMEM64 family)
MNRSRICLLLIFAAVIVLAGFDSALAQCAMCKATIENSTDAAAVSKGLSMASLILLVPPVMIFSGLFVLIYRYRNVQGHRNMPHSRS